jgi:hypothetical protein
MQEGKHRGEMNMFVTRWQEAENRLHIMIDLIAFIGNNSITITFMNATAVISLSAEGKTHTDFKREAHQVIREAFAGIVISSSEAHRSALAGTFLSHAVGETPTLHTLQKSLEEAAGHDMPTAHYLLTDGVPTDCSVNQLKHVILERKDPKQNPITFLSCTNVDEECRWMKEIEEVAPYTAEIDDYLDELSEVVREQGAAFPYTRGMWLICNLVAAINPADLDSLDQRLPLSRFTLQDIMGRTLGEKEYEFYFHNHPLAEKYSDVYSRFLVEQLSAKSIIPEEERVLRDEGKCAIM